jgi:hypothetical protein
VSDGVCRTEAVPALSFPSAACDDAWVCHRVKFVTCGQHRTSPPGVTGTSPTGILSQDGSASLPGHRTCPFCGGRKREGSTKCNVIPEFDVTVSMNEERAR